MFKGLSVAWVLTAVTGMILLCYPGGAAPGAADIPQVPVAKSLRRPVALARSGDGRWLFVANQRSGSISVIDLLARQVIAEYPVGQKLADLTVTKDDAWVLAVDEAAGELIALERQGPKLTVRNRLQVGQTPVSVQLMFDGSKCTVASLWPRQLTIVALGAKPQILQKLDLPFAPRHQLMVAEEKLVVTEAFGGRLAVVDVRAARVESARSLPDHNIRGLSLSADRNQLLLTAQMLNQQGHAQRDDIHWGNLLTNNVRSLRLATVLDPKADLLAGSDLLHLGDVNHGTGDPAGILVCGKELVVSLAGVDELAVGSSAGDSWKYLATGRRPTALLSSADNRTAYVANTFGDSISIVDLTKPKSLAEISLGPVPELGRAGRGERLFYDAHLSHDGWLSCHSCHTDGHTSTRLADTLGDGSYGTPKRILTLLGVGDTKPWAWNGSMAKLENQIAQSIDSTMGGAKPTAEQLTDLSAYLKSLPPAPPRQREPVDDAAVSRGQAVFARQNCARCHTPPLYTSAGTYDVGLADERGHKTFNPPSLRGVSQAGPYFHDGRARTLEDVFSRHRHQLRDDLSKSELADLLSFLGSI